MGSGELRHVKIEVRTRDAKKLPEALQQSGIWHRIIGATDPRAPAPAAPRLLLNPRRVTLLADPRRLAVITLGNMRRFAEERELPPASGRRLLNVAAHPHNTSLHPFVHFGLANEVAGIKARKAEDLLGALERTPQDFRNLGECATRFLGLYVEDLYLPAANSPWPIPHTGSDTTRP